MGKTDPLLPLLTELSPTTLSAHHRVTSRVTTAIDGEALTQEAIAAKLSSGTNSYVTNGMSLAKGITGGERRISIVQHSRIIVH